MIAICIEEPSFAAAGKVHTRDGQLVEPERVCPHRFVRVNTCRCASPSAEVAVPSPDEEHCHARDFVPPAVAGHTCH